MGERAMKDGGVGMEGMLLRVHASQEQVGQGHDDNEIGSG